MTQTLSVARLLSTLSDGNAPEVSEVTEQDYWDYLEMLPPKFMHGSFFAFAEGMMPFILFWQAADRYFRRELSWPQTTDLCRAANIPEDFWARW